MPRKLYPAEEMIYQNATLILFCGSPILPLVARTQMSVILFSQIYPKDIFFFVRVSLMTELCEGLYF